MFYVTLTVTKHLSGPEGRQAVDRLVGSAGERVNTDGGQVATFESVGHNQAAGTFSSANEAVGFILSLARSGGWAVHLTIVPYSGGIFMGDPETANLATGVKSFDRYSAMALRASGGVVVTLLQADDLVHVKALPALGPIESGLQLLCSLERRRSDEGQEAGLMINAGNSQTQTAQQLGVSQQVVSARLQSGYWHESRRAAYWIAEQIQGLVEVPKQSAELRESGAE